jgi:CheY-like chemotaxis protein
VNDAMRPQNAGDEEMEGTLAPDSAPACKHRILVVDDNKDSAESMARLLQMFNHETRTAYDGPSALEAVASFQPDVLLLDIGMPGMDGFEVARRIRLMPRPDRMLIIALTGYGSEADRRQSQEAGVDHHLTKPARLEVLQKLLAAHPRHPG